MRRRRTAIDEEKRVVKDRERARERTMNRAVKLLAAKPRSVGELRERLLEKLWTDEKIVDAVIEKLKEHSYLDDEQFARDTALSHLRRKPQGRYRLRHSMAGKKLDAGTVDAAIEEAFEKLPEIDLLDAAIEKRVRLHGRPQTRDELKKLYDHLMRRGFDYGLVRERIAALTNGDLGDE